LTIQHPQLWKEVKVKDRRKGYGKAGAERVTKWRRERGINEMTKTQKIVLGGLCTCSERRGGWSASTK
jgi:hypothetical protein